MQEIPILLLDRMSAQEFYPLPEDSYIKKQPRALSVLDEPTTVEKAKLLSILQREPERKKILLIVVSNLDLCWFFSKSRKG